MKYGFIDKSSKKDWYQNLGSNKVKEVLFPSGDCEPFIPKWESQIGLYGDTMACCTFSAMDCIETSLTKMGKNDLIVDGLLKVLELYDENGDINGSDRFTAKLSGTTRRGNWFSAVGDSIINDGIIPEKDLDFPYEQRTPVFAWDDYYEEVSNENIAKGMMFNKFFETHYEFIPVNNINIREQLKYGAIQISYSTSSPKVDGVYQNNIAYHSPNHAIMIYKVESDGTMLGLDHYERDGHGHIKFAPDFQFGYYGLQYNIVLKQFEQTPMNMKEKQMYLLVEGASQSLALGVEGKLMFFKDKLDTALNSNWKKPIGVGISDWNSVPHITSKREVIDE